MTWLTKKKYDDQIPKLQSIFDQMIDDFWSTEKRLNPAAYKAFSEKFPAIDLKEKNGKLSVKAELPGVEDEDINLILDHQNLIISGEKKTEQDNEVDGHHYHECTYGSFRRVVGLPYEVDREKIEATFKNGVLKVDLEKDQKLKDKTRNISIKS